MTEFLWNLFLEGGEAIVTALLSVAFPPASNLRIVLLQLCWAALLGTSVKLQVFFPTQE